MRSLSADAPSGALVLLRDALDRVVPGGSPHAVLRALNGWDTRRTIFSEVLTELASVEDGVIAQDACASLSRAAVIGALAELVRQCAFIAETDAAEKCIVLLENNRRTARGSWPGKATYAAAVCVGRLGELRTARTKAEEAARFASAALDSARVAAARGAATIATLHIRHARPAELERNESDDEEDENEDDEEVDDLNEEDQYMADENAAEHAEAVDAAM
jgi:hypothetical protein